jgi:hypothetical protein
MKIFTVWTGAAGSRVIEAEAKETDNFYTFRDNRNPWFQTRIRKCAAEPSRAEAIRVAQEKNEQKIERLQRDLEQAQDIRLQLQELAALEVR